MATWFDDAEILELTDTRMSVLSPSEFRRETIQRRWIPYIKDAMQVLFDMDVDVVLLGEEDRKALTEKTEHPDFIVNNPQFTFKSFVVGASNRFAHGAALAVANKPADAYNPLFIYGESGLGKTHLLYAIAAEIHAQHPEFNIVYIRGDQFTNEMIAGGRPFADVIGEFLDWCGEDFVFTTWSKNDILAVEDNMLYHGLDIDDLPECYDIQLMFDDQVTMYDKRMPLNYAIWKFDFKPEPQHDALSDAINTAEVFRRLDLEELEEYAV